jgi:hypothetical protein
MVMVVELDLAKLAGIGGGGLLGGGWFVKWLLGRLKHLDESKVNTRECAILHRKTEEFVAKQDIDARDIKVETSEIKKLIAATREDIARLSGANELAGLVRELRKANSKPKL